MAKLVLQDVLGQVSSSDTLESRGELRISGGGNLVASCVYGMTAVGTAQTDATILSATHNVFTTVGSNTGAIIPSTTPAGYQYNIVNRGSNSLKVYPPSGHAFLGSAPNQVFTMLSGQAAEFVGIGAVEWLPRRKSVP